MCRFARHPTRRRTCLCCDSAFGQHARLFTRRQFHRVLESSICSNPRRNAMCETEPKISIAAVPTLTTTNSHYSLVILNRPYNLLRKWPANFLLGIPTLVFFKIPGIVNRVSLSTLQFEAICSCAFATARLTCATVSCVCARTPVIDSRFQNHVMQSKSLHLVAHQFNLCF